MSAFLDPADLVQLTGYKRPADQARWLEARGIPFVRNSRGHLVVSRELRETILPSPELGPVR